MCVLVLDVKTCGQICICPHVPWRSRRCRLGAPHRATYRQEPATIRIDCTWMRCMLLADVEPLAEPAPVDDEPVPEVPAVDGLLVEPVVELLLPDVPVVLPEPALPLIVPVISTR
jgi:hypothetical protein